MSFNPFVRAAFTTGANCTQNVFHCFNICWEFCEDIHPFGNRGERQKEKNQHCAMCIVHIFNFLTTKKMFKLLTSGCRCLSVATVCASHFHRVQLKYFLAFLTLFIIIGMLQDVRMA